jgi:hypothetical protein
MSFSSRDISTDGSMLRFARLPGQRSSENGTERVFTRGFQTFPDVPRSLIRSSSGCCRVKHSQCEDMFPYPVTLLLTSYTCL